VCKTDGALGHQGSIALAALSDREQVGFPGGWGIRALADSALRSAGIEPHVDVGAQILAPMPVNPAARALWEMLSQ